MTAGVSLRPFFILVHPKHPSLKTAISTCKGWQTVDEFVEPLVQDYIALYNENAVLKDKLRVLVKKLEEFRDEEDARKAAIAAQEQACAEKMQQTEEACRVMLAKAEATAASRNSEEQVAQEEQRLNCAKELALNFISVLEQDIQGHLALLNSLRSRDLTQEVTTATKKAVAEARAAMFADTRDPAATRKIAGEIEQNLNKMGLAEEAPAAEPARPAPRPTADTMKLDELQFGKNYSPVK